jgi:hypothetical protein
VNRSLGLSKTTTTRRAHHAGWTPPGEVDLANLGIFS